MKNILGILIILLLTVSSVFSADMRFVQVDGLLYNETSSDKFVQLIEKINKEKNVEFIIFTGNNIAKPNKAELESFLKCAKNLNRPFYIVLGQKDVNKKKGLGKKEYMEMVHKKAKAHRRIQSPSYMFEKKGVLFIVVDGSKEVIPTTNGYYKEDVILWLDEQLDNNKDKNVVIVQHYPLVPPCIKETYYTFKADEYLKLLSEHKNVKAVVAGHFNASNEQNVNGVLHISTQDAPTYRIIDILDCDTANPTFWSTLKE